MNSRTIVAMPGDGIGKSVLPEAVRVLDAVGFEAEYVHGDIGWEFWVREGNALPERTIELLSKHKLGLLGAITSKPKAEAAAELHPSLQGKGYDYFSPVVALRQRFHLDVCLRPCRSFAGNPLNFVRRLPDGTIEEPFIDVAVFRQNTEGLYCGIEWTHPPDDLCNALSKHARWRPFARTPPEEIAISLRVFTQAACRRIVAAAFHHASEHGYRSVTVCEKPNVLRETSGMMEDAVREIRENYPEIEVRSSNIDTQMMWLTKNPEDYGVFVGGNLIGDITSDAFAGLVGGLGFACSGNIGEEVAVFEPTHGSAPKYETFDPQIVNPTAMILSAAMLLDHVGETSMAERVRRAVAEVVREGRVRTYDMLGLRGGPDVLDRGAASMTEMTNAIIARI